MSAPSRREYDWAIGDYGFRLASAKLTGAHPHSADPIEFLAQQISSTAEATYTDINRKGEFAFAQDDLSEGIATKYKFGLDTQRKYRYAKGVDTSFPGHTLPASKIVTLGAAIATQPTGWVQRGSISYASAGALLYQVTTAGPVLDTTFAQTITHLFVWGGFLIVGFGESQTFRYRASDVSAGAFSDGGVNGRLFAASGDLLYKVTRPRTVSIADAITGPWADYDVGDTSYNITSLGFSDQVAIVGKEDGPYAFDLDFVAQPLVPELHLQADAAICKAAAAYNRDYFVSTRLGAVRIRPAEGLKYVGLDTLADPALPSGTGTISAFTTDGRFLYALVSGTSVVGVYIWKYDYNGNWHNFQYRTDLGQGADFIQAVSKIGATSLNAITFAYKSGVNWQFAYAQFPATFDPTKDTSYQYETAVTGYVRTLDYSAAYPTVLKFADRVKGVADNLAATRKVTMAAYLDDETVSRLIASFQKSPFSEEKIKALPQCHRLSLEIGFLSEVASAPQFKAFHLSTDLLPRVIRLHRVNFIAASSIPLATGGATRGEWQPIVDSLREMRANRQTVACRDENLREFDGYIEDMTEWTAGDKVTGEPVQVITATVKEVAADS